VFWEEIRSTTHLTRPLCYTNVCLSSSCIHRRRVSIHTRISPGHGNRHLGGPVRPRTILSKVLKIIIRRTSIKYSSTFKHLSYGDCLLIFGFTIPFHEITIQLLGLFVNLGYTVLLVKSPYVRSLVTTH